MNLQEFSLPLEIWEIIWSNMCIEDLTRSKRVSSFWYKNIEKIAKNEDWQSKCIAEIPRGVLYSLFKEICGTDMIDKNLIKPIIWFKTYKNFKLWQRNYSSGCVNAVISINNRNGNKTDEFSCMAVHGEILALGTMNGFIYFYHLSNLQKSFFIADHLECVIKIEFWETDDGIRGVSQCQNEKIKFWDLNRKKEDKNYFSYGSFMVASGDTLYTTSCGDDRIGVRSGSSICKFKKSQFQEITMGEHKLYIDDDYYPINATIKNFQAEDYGDTKILSITSVDKNYVGVYEVHYESGLFVYGLKEVEQLPEIINESTIKKIYVYDHVKFILANDNICINIPGCLWTIYHNIFMKLRGVIKCLAYHANLLILGLDSGELHIIKLNHQNDLQHLDFNSCNKKVYMLDYLPIINVNFSMGYNKRFVFAMSTSKVFVIKL